MTLRSSLRTANATRRSAQQANTYRAVADNDTRQYSTQTAGSYDADTGRQTVIRTSGTIAVRGVGQVASGQSVVAGNGYGFGGVG